MCQKNYKNRAWFDKVIAKIKWCTFLYSQCSACAYRLRDYTYVQSTALYTATDLVDVLKSCYWNAQENTKSSSFRILAPSGPLLNRRTKFWRNRAVHGWVIATTDWKFDNERDKGKFISGIDLRDDSATYELWTPYGQSDHSHTGVGASQFIDLVQLAVTGYLVQPPANTDQRVWPVRTSLARIVILLCTQLQQQEQRKKQRQEQHDRRSHCWDPGPISRLFNVRFRHVVLEDIA